MKRFLFAFSVLFILLAFIFVQWGGISIVKAAPDIHQGDLILQGNNVTFIEGRFDINGSIIVEENATLHLLDAYVNFTQTELRQYNLTLRNPVNGNPRLLAYNSTITSTYRAEIYIDDNSTAEIENSTLTFNVYTVGSPVISMSANSSAVGLYMWGYSTARIYNSTLFRLASYDTTQVEFIDSETYSLFVGPYSISCEISNLQPGITNYWNFITNSSVIILPGGHTPNITLTNTKIDTWEFGFYGYSNATIKDSVIEDASAITGSSTVFLQSTFCEGSYVSDSSVLLATDSNITGLRILNSANCLLLNTTYTSLQIEDFAKIHILWHLGVQVIDSTDQNVPSANVTAAYTNATIAEQKLTDTNGETRLALMEKMMNATGEYHAGNYTVEATYDIYSASTSINMTENKQITLKLEGFVIPEQPSLFLLPLAILSTLLAVIIYRKKGA